MPALRIIPLPASVAELVRRTRRDAHGNHDLTPQPVQEPHSAPCRVCLRDGELGEPMLLLGYGPFATAHPYRTVGPIFVHAEPCVPFDAEAAGGRVPDSLRTRLLSVRAHDRDGRMLDCDVTPGEHLLPLAERLLSCPGAHELHVHHAAAGCFACRIVPQ